MKQLPAKEKKKIAQANQKRKNARNAKRKEERRAIRGTMRKSGRHKERKDYYVTKNLAELKKAWEDAGLEGLEDEEFKNYLGRQGFPVDNEEDDDTMTGRTIRFVDNYSTQWFPVSTLYTLAESTAEVQKSEQKSILQQDYHVAEILEKRWNDELRRHEWLVWWRGYRKSESTWEPFENVDSNEQFAEFEKNSRS